MIFNLIISVLDFPSTKLPLHSKGRTRVENLHGVRHLGSFRLAKFIDELESCPTDGSGLFKFHFPIDFIGGQ